MNEQPDWVWRGLLENIALGVLILDLKAQRIVWQNRAMSDLFPASPPDYALVKNYFLTALLAEGQGNTEQQTIDLAGKTIGFTVYPAENDMCLILAAAISEKEWQRKLSQTSSLMNVLDYLFFNLAHELGNPINSIKMTLEVLINNFDEYSAATKLEYLTNLHAGFKRLETLLQAIKSFNMFEQLNIGPTDMGALVENLLQLLGEEIASKHLSVQNHVEPGSFMVAGDPRALHQVLLHLMSNAIDALVGVGDPRITIEARQCKGRVHIEIGDNGCGIPEHRQKELFLPFFSGKPQGIGLGLSMIKKLLTQMNGAIEINSRPGRGTTVYITLPVPFPPHDN